MTEDIMIDLETLATHSNAVILTIACIKFKKSEKIDRSILANGEKCFYRRITISSCEEIGLEKEQETIDWWKKQSYDARKEVGMTDEVVWTSPIKSVLTDLNKWVGNDNNIIVWCNGASFDFPILSNAYRKCALTPFWKFWNERDCRTVYALHKKQLKKYTDGEAHHALLDSFHQIRCLQDCLK